MKYALLSSIGGEPIEAKDADYSHYNGFLKCPECGQKVFLRKEHNRGRIQVPAAFIHHKAIPEISVCELRVGNYSKVDVERMSSKAKGQRLSRLRVSLWKYIKTNLAVDLSQWSKYKKDVESTEIGREILKYAYDFVSINKDFILNDTLEKCQYLFLNKDNLIGVKPHAKEFFDYFVEKNKYHWELHYKIAKEMLEDFLNNPEFHMIRVRLLCCFCHPSIFSEMPGLLDSDITEEEFLNIFGAFLTIEIAFVFITINWVEIFKA